MSKITEKLKALYNKIVREQASPEYIARGWAIGMFWGCICPFGLQLLFSIPTSFILKGSKIGATIGTLITNHFTIFLIYPVQCYVGCLITGRPLSYEALMNTGFDLIVGFLVGGALFAAIMTPLTYFGVKRMVINFRRKNREE